MKKIKLFGKLCLVMFLCMTVLVGCGKKEESKTATAKFSATNNGVEMVMEMEFTYTGEYVNVQKQNCVYKGKSLAELEAFVASYTTKPFQEIADKNEGLEYKLIRDEKGPSLTENVTIDFGKVSKEAYAEFTGQTLPDGKVGISLEKTLSSLEQQGFTITK